MWSLDGVLRYVPFCALHDGDKYLAERYRSVVFTPASQARLKDEPKASWSGLGLGVSKAHEGFDALPAMTDELRDIIHEEGSSATDAGLMPGVVKLDEGFTEETMFASLRQGYPVVHVSSHFELRPGNESDSFLLLGDGKRLTLADWDGEALMKLFRERLLARLVEKKVISQELAMKLFSWRHPGFSVHIGEPIPPDNPKAVEDMAGYVVRNPLSLRRLVYIDGQQAVIYRALKHNPTLRRNFESLDALEWLARMTDHIPDRGRHRTLFYGHYANRVRGERARAGLGEEEAEERPVKKRRCSASWARLISKVYNVDPLTCRKCGGKLTVVAYLHDQIAIKGILDHLGLSEPEQERPPPPEVRYVPVDEEEWEIATP